MLTSEQVTALTAQAAKYATSQREAYVGFPYDDAGNLLTGWTLNINNEPVYIGSLLGVVGIGVYGQTPENLTLAGYLKPGVLSLITDSSMVSVVLNTPAVWSGQLGVNSLQDYLDNTDIQNLTQISLMVGAYEGLIVSGVLDGNESARYTATFLQPATVFGVNNVIAWVSNQADGDLVSKLMVVAREGQYAIDFVQAFSDVLNTLPQLEGATNTVIRTEIDELVSAIIDNQKIPALEYADPPLNPTEIPGTTGEDGTFRKVPKPVSR